MIFDSIVGQSNYNNLKFKFSTVKTIRERFKTGCMYSKKILFG